MSAFKPGHGVLVDATVCEVVGAGTAVCIRLPGDGRHLVVPTSHVHPAPDRDPELRPGMVVAADDPADDREWWVAEGADGALGFLNAEGAWFIRDELDCDRLRIVHPQVTP